MVAAVEVVVVACIVHTTDVPSAETKAIVSPASTQPSLATVTVAVAVVPIPEDPDLATTQLAAPLYE